MGHASFTWDMTHKVPLASQIMPPVMRNDPFIWDMTCWNETWLIHMGHDSWSPQKKLLGSGFQIPYSPFSLIYTIHFYLHYAPICTRYQWVGVDICWFPVDGFDTRCIPRLFSCGMCCDSFIWDMTYSHGMWLIQMGYGSFIWDVTNSYGIWLIHMGYDAFILDRAHSYGIWLIHMGYD